MRRIAVVVGLGLGVLTAAGSASADEPAGFANQGQFIFSADRLFSLFSYEDQKSGPDSATTSVSSTHLGLFAGVNTGTVFTVPRLALDYTVTPNITVGGSAFILGTLGGSTTTTNGSMSVSESNDKVTAWGLAPRAGYILPITDTFSFWGRLGFSYISSPVSPASTTTNGTTTTPASTTVSEFDIDVEPMFVFSPVNHFGFVFGPTLDIPLTGSESSGGTSVNNTEIYFGVQVGLLGYF